MRLQLDDYGRICVYPLTGTGRLLLSEDDNGIASDGSHIFTYYLSDFVALPFQTGSLTGWGTTSLGILDSYGHLYPYNRGDIWVDHTGVPVRIFSEIYTLTPYFYAASYSSFTVTLHNPSTMEYSSVSTSSLIADHIDSINKYLERKMCHIGRTYINLGSGFQNNGCYRYDSVLGNSNPYVTRLRGADMVYNTLAANGTLMYTRTG